MLPNHTHTHDLTSDQDSDLAGNIDINVDQTATTAYSSTHATLPVFSLDQMIDDIDNLSTWSANTVTFSFPSEESDDYIGSSLSGTLNQFSDTQIAAARDVMNLFGDLIDVAFVDSNDDVDADIRFYNSTLSGTAAASPAGSGTSGDTWFYNYDPNTIENYNLDPGSYQYHLLVHELGHVMGLSHTSFGAGANYVEKANYLQNNAAFSAMSYLTAGSAGLSWDTTYSSTPMLVDVAALQSLYGANMTTRTGDTVYGFNATADRPAFNFDALLAAHGEIGAITIWDAGGTDTLDMSKFSQDGFINLTSGTHSSVGGYDLNLAIAQGAVIEHAIGGSGDDIILGNDAANDLTGGLGADTLKGGQGNDRLFGEDQVVEIKTYTHAAVTLTGDQSVSYTVDGTGVTALTIEMQISFDPAQTSAQWFADMPGDWTIVYDAGNSGMWYRANSTWQYTGIGPSSFADGDMHRLTVVYDGENGAAKLYLDGALVTTINDGLVPALNMGVTETVSFSHDGALADVRIFNTVRSAQDIQDNAFSALPADTAGIISYVTFENDSGTDLKSGSNVSLSDGVSFANATVLNNNDVLDGGDGDDLLVGGSGADHLTGGAGNDVIRGGSGNDRAYSGKGTDTVDLGDGNDYVRVGGGIEVFSGGAGKDYISYYDSTGGVTLDLTANTASGSWASNDTILDFESVSGSKTGGDNITGTSDANTIKTYGGNDRVYAGKGSDRVDLGDGNDYVRVGGGVEVFSGGAGKDYISYYDSTGGVTLDLTANTASRSWASNDTISGFESASGSKTGDDKIFGTSDANTIKTFGGNDALWGRGGDDKMYGGDGNDRFDGGAGTDVLYGGNGADVFHLDLGEDHDIIKDFEDDVDTIELDNFTFSVGQNAFDFATQVGAHVTFDFGNGDMLTVENATVAQLHNDLEMV